MQNYITQILGLPVFDNNGKRYGKVMDILASSVVRLPTITAFYIKGEGGEGWVSIKQLAIEDKRVSLKSPAKNLVYHQPTQSDIRLQRDILDKQIVDVHDCRVIRVNDVRIAPVNDSFCVVAADASFRALARRAGIGVPLEAIAGLFRRPMHSNLIAWDDVGALEPGMAGGGRIKLKVPHEKIARLHPADIADIIEQLDPQQQAEVIDALDLETAADTLQEMDEEDAAAVMERMEHEKAADILEEMEPDDAADLLADLSDARSEALLDKMEPEDAADVKELLAYGEETAGGLMTTEFISIDAKMTADQTIQRLRDLAPGAEIIYYLYVVDEQNRLVGVITLRDLIVASPDTRIGAIMSSNVRCVHVHDHANNVAHAVSRYNLLAIPVVNEDGELEGIITVDDMLERLLPPERRKRLPQVTLDE